MCVFVGTLAYVRGTGGHMHVYLCGTHVCLREAGGDVCACVSLRCTCMCTGVCRVRVSLCTLRCVDGWAVVQTEGTVGAKAPGERERLTSRP